MKYKLRSVYVAPPGYVLISCDLSQAETWIVAYSANEDGMKDALNNSNIHARTASVFFNIDENVIKKNRKSSDIKVLDEANSQYYIGKQNNHALAYREGAHRLMQSINEKSHLPPFLTVTLSETTRWYTLWHGYYKAIKTWWASIEEQLRRDRTLTTPYHRKRRFFERWGDELFKAATAHIPQSTIADHAFGKVQEELGIEGGMYGIWKAFQSDSLKHEARIIQTSHDSMMNECRKEIWRDVGHIMQKNMQRPLIVNDQQFTIPTELEVGERWGELEKVIL